MERSEPGKPIPRIALAHDYLTQRGGAERVALALTSMFPGAPLYTSLFAADTTFPGFADVDVRTTSLQRLPALRRDPRRAFPLLARTWTRVVPRATDAVVVSSSGWAHMLKTPAGVAKIVYCHNPPRWLHQTDEYVRNRAERWAVRAMQPRLAHADRAGAEDADLYFANSTVVAERIRAAYGIEPRILFPPVTVNHAGPREAAAGVRPGFYLAVARSRGYKNITHIVDAFRDLPDERLVVVGGEITAQDRTPPNVHRTGVVSDAVLRWLYAEAKALVTVSFEDFGLTPIEANAFGTPVLALKAGGHLDTVREGVSGWWIDAPRPAAIREAVERFRPLGQGQVRSHAARFGQDAFARTLKEAMEAAVESRRVDSRRNAEHR